MKLAFALMAVLVVAAVFAAREWTLKQTDLYAANELDNAMNFALSLNYFQQTWKKKQQMGWQA